MVEEGAAYGAALLGGVAGGTWPDTAAAVAACVQVRGEVEPEPAWIAPYAEGRARFRALYPALRDAGLSQRRQPGAGQASVASSRASCCSRRLIARPRAAPARRGARLAAASARWSRARLASVAATGRAAPAASGRKRAAAAA